jgi:hypothetical protein
MAHYAFLDANNVVTEVIVGRDEDEVVDGISDWEAHYAQVRGQTCLRTSYNTYMHVEYDDDGEIVLSESRHRTGGVPFRGKYAAIGDFYNAELDEFVTPNSGDAQ